MSDREELIRNAVSFLLDPKTQASPLTQRIQFLEAKGLTPPEIDLAVRQASVNQTVPTNTYQASYSSHSYPHPSQRWDWRDYFIGAVVSGTVVYGAVSLFKKYLLPHLQPPDATVYEEDRDALTAQFDAAEALLKEIQAETAAVKSAVEEQKEKVDKTIRDVEEVVSEMRQGESKTRDEMREIRDEIDTIREMIPKMMEKNKESQAQTLAELQQELKSLKALLMSRGPSVSNISSPSPMIGRPSIPAWQLSGSSTAPSTANASIPATSSTPITGPNPSEDKGKGVDIS
ncbi:peroxisomal membrane anchor protein [Moniliophthora roreri MCA 2997]|uniref:Peroxisomal membrane protein PEX14 n=2 Tax=Moniliophthora roreri TaxID=221103 RepID=V2X518_MONRO|nr:peroxisomal membrane anchor protein [Moniliophthora roreri MCA 2997]